MMKEVHAVTKDVLTARVIPTFLRLLMQQPRTDNELEFAVAPDAYQLGIGGEIEVEDVLRELLARRLIEAREGRYRTTARGEQWLADQLRPGR